MAVLLLLTAIRTAAAAADGSHSFDNIALLQLQGDGMQMQMDSVPQVSNSGGAGEAKSALEQLKSTTNKSLTKPRPLRPKPSEAGYVESLYTFGAPGSASPGLRRNDGSCFAGQRVFSGYESAMWSGGWRYDPVAWAANAAWLWHPKMDAVRLNDHHPEESEILKCSTDVQKQPPWEHEKTGVTKELHSSERYYPAIEGSGDVLDFKEEAIPLFKASYEEDPEEVQKMLKEFGLGYNVVGAARYAGSATTGSSVSYLLQHEETLDCFVTFQGSVEFNDWWTDASAFTEPFCGLTEEGDNCCSVSHALCGGECDPTGDGISFVHVGFRNNLRRMVSDPSFQENVHSKLPSCKAVKAFGHSLGGAMAELFTACADQYLLPGDFGYEEDYKNIGWNKSSPEKLPVKTERN